MQYVKDTQASANSCDFRLRWCAVNKLLPLNPCAFWTMDTDLGRNTGDAPDKCMWTNGWTDIPIVRWPLGFNSCHDFVLKHFWKKWDLQRVTPVFDIQSGVCLHGCTVSLDLPRKKWLINTWAKHLHSSWQAQFLTPLLKETPVLHKCHGQQLATRESRISLGHSAVSDT